MHPSLSSWKEIANLLGVGVRTAQKWERERGLPVRRNNAGRISADHDALVAWQASHHDPHEQCFRWPVGKDSMAEVRFTGPTLSAGHVELLRQYLELVKAALQ